MDLHFAYSTLVNAPAPAVWAHSARLRQHCLKTLVFNRRTNSIELLEPLEFAFVAFAFFVFVLTAVDGLHFEIFNAFHALIQGFSVLIHYCALFVDELSDCFDFQVCVHLHWEKLFSTDLSLHFSRQLSKLFFHVGRFDVG